MAWKRDSDTIAFDPRVLAVIEHPGADRRSVNEVWGFFSRMAGQVAQLPTEEDYVCDYPTGLQLAGNDPVELERLWEQCEFACLGVRVTRANGRRGFQLVNDPDFVHMKTAEEIAFEQQRKKDNSDPHITVRVRLRDGDACRYCGMVVFWSQRRGDKRGTYDHRPPGQPASAETSVACCGACNSGRGGLSKGLPPDAGLRAADLRYPLLPAPDRPYYSPSTREWMQQYTQLLSQYGLVPPPLARPGTATLKAGTPAPGAAAATPQGPAQPATGDAIAEPRAARPRRPPAAPPGKEIRNQQNGSLQDPDLPGRDGSGRDGKGRIPPALPSTASPPARRRGNRGGRRKRNTGGNS